MLKDSLKEQRNKINQHEIANKVSLPFLYSVFVSRFVSALFNSILRPHPVAIAADLACYIRDIARLLLLLLLFIIIIIITLIVIELYRSYT